MIALLARPLAVAAALGWFISVAASIAGLAGVQLPQWLMGAMFVGLFPIWIVTILSMNKLMVGVAQQDMMKAAFRGCPAWLRYAIRGAWAYTFVMFALIISGREEAAIGFIGVFYATALGTFVTASTIGDEPTKCVNDHTIGPFDKFCRECGAAIIRTNSVRS